MKKFITLSLSVVLIAQTLAPTTITYANHVNESRYLEQLEASSFNPESNLIFNDKELKEMGFSLEQIKKLQNYKISGIYLIDGIAYDSSGNLINSSNGAEQFGRFTWAVNAIRKGYNSLPAKVRNTIMGYTSIEEILRLVEHYSGTLEDAIYNACRSV